MTVHPKRFLSTTLAVSILLGLSSAAARGLKETATQGAKGTKSAPKVAAKEAEVLPHMDQALAYLRAAQREVKESEPWFGGHRDKALVHVSAAVSDLQSGINEFMSKHPSATRNEINPDTIEVKMGLHFETAQKLTQQASDELNEASAEFYGKRAAAITEAKAALAEMQAGITYYRAHPHNK